MSELALRVAVVAEGWTDRDVIAAAVTALLGKRSFILRLLQPEDAAATLPFGNTGRPGGWGGVCRWCREAVDRAGRLGEDVLAISAYDVLILHLDADMAASNYPAAHIHNAPDPTDLPCEQPCPPPAATTDALRAVLLGWAGETTIPAGVVLCTPSKNIEAWVLAALYPNDAPVLSGGLECRPTPENLLAAKPAAERLIRSGKKQRDRYQARGPDIALAWPVVRAVCTEAERFSVDFVVAASAPAR